MRHTRALAERLTYTDLRFTLVPTGPCTLPNDLGSTLRGALGHALREMACPHTCPLPSADRRWSCSARAFCAYADWFEPVTRPDESPDGSSAADVPRGFVLRPSLSPGRAFDADSPLRFTVRLFGRVAVDAPRVVGAVARMAQVGLGRASPVRAAEASWDAVRAAAQAHAATPAEQGLLERIAVHAPGRARFELTRVDDAVGRCLWVPGARSVEAPTALAVLRPDFAPSPAARLFVRLESPLWVRGYDRRAPVFDVLREVVLRRIRDVAAYWHGCTAPPDDDEGHAPVRLDTLGLQSRRWHRFSTDQGRKVEQRGLTGTLVLRGPDLGRHLWWLEAAQALHLGKDTAFGLGRVRWSLDDGETFHDGIDVRAVERGAGDRGLDRPARALGDGGSGEPGPT